MLYIVGLASVVGSIGKKAKMGCLDKSQLDWNQFVQVPIEKLIVRKCKIDGSVPFRRACQELSA